MEGERRRYGRDTCLITCHVRSGTRIYDGTVTSICEDGAFIGTQAPIEEETAFQLRFRHPHSGQMIKARAVVARRVRPGSGAQGLGVRLVDTLSMLEPGAGAVASHSGTWAVPELSSTSGTWSAITSAHSLDAVTPGLTSGSHTPASGNRALDLDDRRGVNTPDTRRASASRRRVSITVPGAGPAMALLHNISEAGFSAACEHPPPEGKLFRLSIPAHGTSIDVTARVVWRADSPGGLRSFGAEIVQFGGSKARESYQALLSELSRL